MSGSVVYVIRSIATGTVKIGFSKRMAKRVNDLEGAHPGELEVLRTIPGGRQTEKWMHNHFASACIGGEWFRYDPQMLVVEPPDEAPVVYKSRASKPPEKNTRIIRGAELQKMREILQLQAKLAAQRAAHVEDYVGFLKLCEEHGVDPYTDPDGVEFTQEVSDICAASWKMFTFDEVAA